MNSFNIVTMMWKKALLILAAVIIPFAGNSQNPGLERLNSYKIAFFTKRLNLTPKEAEKFWPVYNEFQGKKNEIQKERILLNRNALQNASAMSEKEIEEAGDKLISLEAQEADLAMEYHARFKEVLPPVKVLRLYQAENQYRLQLLNELQQRKQGQRNPDQKR